MNKTTFALGSVGNGTLSIGPRPQTGQLRQWAESLQKQNISHVVSLIEDSEVETHNLHNEGSALAALGMAFSRFPIADFGIPDVKAFTELMNDLSQRLKSGDHIFLHCAGGVGRAGTTASCLLVEHGWDAEDAMAHVSKIRGVASPETPEQVAFIRSWKTA